MFRVLATGILLTCVFANPVQKAVVKIEGNVQGEVAFYQNGPEVVLIGEIKGLKPGPHGFHIHVSGDLSKGCASAGSHFNPFHRNHGDISTCNRHVGDLGNIIADENGVATVNIRDSLISLNGITSIIGRSVVVHADVDDLGFGGHEDSLTTGHAGGRAGCGVIGIVE